MSTSTIGIKCSCGSTKFHKPANPKPSDTVKCAKCGASGTWGEVMGQATSQVTSAMEKHLKDVFRKAGFK